MDRDARNAAAHRGARFSCYASIAVYIVTGCVGALGGTAPETAGYLLLLGTLVLAVALGRGITGLLGGLRCGERGTVLFAFLGVTLSGIPLGLLVCRCLGHP